MNNGKDSNVMGREIPRNEIRMVIDQRTETGMQTNETGKNNGKVNGRTTIGENDLTTGEQGNKESLWAYGQGGVNNGEGPKMLEQSKKGT